MIDIRNAPIKNSDTSTWPIGTWLFPAHISGFAVTTPASAVAGLYPVVVPVKAHVTALAVYLKTLSAGGAIQLGLYADNNGSPAGGQLLAETAEIDCSTGSGSLKSAAIDVILPPGLYWLCSNNKVAGPIFERISSAGVNKGAFFTTDTTLPFGSGMRGYVSAGIAYGPLPAVCPAVLPDNGSANIFPIVRMGNAA
ncbi:hypothetical protein [Caulobacter sp.]|uniref:hypothetical protein n=1 Tax=Caulobacter sp. TaxID=78 RepID=UPI003BB0AFBC